MYYWLVTTRYYCHRFWLPLVAITVSHCWLLVAGHDRAVGYGCWLRLLVTTTTIVANYWLLLSITIMTIVGYSGSINCHLLPTMAAIAICYHFIVGRLLFLIIAWLVTIGYHKLLQATSFHYWLLATTTIDTLPWLLWLLRTTTITIW